MPRLYNSVYFIFLFLTSSSLLGQIEEEHFHYGFSAGVTQSSLGEIRTTLIRPIFPEDTYKTRSEDLVGFTASAFVYYRFRKSQFAIQPEINYMDGGGIFNYQDTDDLMYDIQFNYAYLQIAPMIKYYMAAGAYITLGPQLGMIVDRSALGYTSNQPELGPDLQIQQSLREVLKGNNNISMSLGAGYDTTFGLGISFRYNYGISDAMETLANGFYFIENDNPTRSISLSLSYAIPFAK